MICRPALLVLPIVAVLSAAAAAQDPATLSQGLAGYWKLDETSAASVLDSSGNQLTGVGTAVTIAATVPPGMQFPDARAFEFNGSGSYITPPATHFAAITDTFTMAFWALPTGDRTHTDEATSGAPGTANQRYAIFPMNGDATWGGSNQAGAGVSVGRNGISVFEHTGYYLPSLLVYDAPANFTGWIHVAVVYTNKKPALYVNGALVPTPNSKTSGKVVHPSAAIGTYKDCVGYGPYSGSLDDVRVYGRALSADEISMLAQGQGVVGTSGLAQGLAGLWRLDEPLPGAVNDAGPNALGGTTAGGVTSVAPGNAAITFPDSGAASFNGTTGMVTVPDHAALQIAGDITISFWAYPTAEGAVGWQRLVGKGSGPSRTYGVWRENQTGNHKLLFQCYSDTGANVLELTSSTTIPVNAWSHVVAVVSGTNAALYVNGNQRGTATRTGAPGITADPLTFAHSTLNSDSQYYQGRLDEVRIYNRALSAMEIIALAGGLGGENRPTKPLSLKQIDPFTGAEVVAPGQMQKPAAKFKGTSSTPSGSVALQVEVKPQGDAFSGMPSATGGYVASGLPAEVRVVGLDFNRSYHWQYRSMNSDGIASDWTLYGASPTATDFHTAVAGPPPTAGATQQRDPDSGEPIVAGGSVLEGGRVRIEALLVDPDGSQVLVQVEVAPAETAFANAPSATSDLVPSGSTASIEIGFSRPGAYRWQTRAVNEWGQVGAWAAGGGQPDLVIVGIGSKGNTLGDMVDGGIGCGASAGGAGWGPALLLFLVLRRRSG